MKKRRTGNSALETLSKEVFSAFARQARVLETLDSRIVKLFRRLLQDASGSSFVGTSLCACELPPILKACLRKMPASPCKP
jgi:hypothetical protein